MSGDHNMYCSANNPKDEWTDLPTLVSVCNAQTDNWEIEYRTLYDGWAKWSGSSWHVANKYRARPRQPNLRKVKMLAYLDARAELRWMADEPASSGWTRVPAEDKTIEIPEGV